MVYAADDLLRRGMSTERNMYHHLVIAVFVPFRTLYDSIQDQHSTVRLATQEKEGRHVLFVVADRDEQLRFERSRIDSRTDLFRRRMSWYCDLS